MALNQLQIIGLTGIPEVSTGDDLPHLIAQAIGEDDLRVHNQDILVIAQISRAHV